MGPSLHKIGDRAPVTRTFDEKVGDDCYGLRVIEFHATVETLPRDHRGNRDQKLIFLAWRQMHLLCVWSVPKLGSALPSDSAVIAETTALRS